MKRVKDGAIGDIVAARAYWNQGGLWNKPRQAGWSDMEYQLRNWLYYTWLSGDHIVEQHVHNLDVVNWGMGGIPVRVVGVGGRQARVQPEYGHIYDHFGLDYEYANGVHMMSMCRQQPGTAKGFVFLLLEDEFGMLNVIVPPWLHDQQRAMVRGEAFVIVQGELQRKENTVNLLARRFERLPVPKTMKPPESHNFG